MSSSLLIHTGLWINWAYGSILGPTLTISSRDGAYLVAFLALFVQLTGSHFWSLLSYFIFKVRKTDKPKDGLYHQYQAILRNTQSDVQAIWQFQRTGWAWRKKLKDSSLRATGYSMIAILNLVIFTTAGIFSSWVTKANSDVLLQSSPLCGDFESKGAFHYTNTTSVSLAQQQEFNLSWASFLKNGMEQSTFYARYCNISNSQNSCPPLGRRQIDFITTVNSSSGCPFNPQICDSNISIHMDTGIFDSLTDLGINSKKEDRVGFRAVLECAPIKTEGYTTGWLNLTDKAFSNYKWYSSDSKQMMFFYGKNHAYDDLDTNSNTTLGNILANLTLSLEDNQVSTGTGSYQPYLFSLVVMSMSYHTVYLANIWCEWKYRRLPSTDSIPIQFHTY
jgi:hypothetical protein